MREQQSLPGRGVARSAVLSQRWARGTEQLPGHSSRVEVLGKHLALRGWSPFVRCFGRSRLWVLALPKTPSPLLTPLSCSTPPPVRLCGWRGAGRAAALVGALRGAEETPSLPWACSGGEQRGWGFPAGAHPGGLAAGCGAATPAPERLPAARHADTESSWVLPHRPGGLNPHLEGRARFLQAVLSWGHNKSSSSRVWREPCAVPLSPSAEAAGSGGQRLGNHLLLRLRDLCTEVKRCSHPDNPSIGVGGCAPPSDPERCWGAGLPRRDAPTSPLSAARGSWDGPDPTAHSPGTCAQRGTRQARSLRLRGVPETPYRVALPFCKTGPCRMLRTVQAPAWEQGAPGSVQDRALPRVSVTRAALSWRPSVALAGLPKAMLQPKRFRGRSWGAPALLEKLLPRPPQPVGNLWLVALKCLAFIFLYPIRCNRMFSLSASMFNLLLNPAKLLAAAVSNGSEFLQRC